MAVPATGKAKAVGSIKEKPPLVPRKPEYRPLTREAAAQIAQDFGVSEHADVIFTRVTGATDAQKRFLIRPNADQVRNALEELAKPLRRATRAATKHQTTLAKALYVTLLKSWGELLTADAIYELSGAYVIIPPHVQAISDRDEFEAQARLHRSIAAAQAGGKLLVPFFEEMLKQVEDSLRQLGPPASGRRLKHLFRLCLIMDCRPQSASGWLRRWKLSPIRTQSLGQRSPLLPVCG
jgi:hypothetical protein